MSPNIPAKDRPDNRGNRANEQSAKADVIDHSEEETVSRPWKGKEKGHDASVAPITLAAPVDVAMADPIIAP